MKIISKIFKFVLTFMVISAVIYFGIAAVLILTGKPRKPDQAQRGPAFDELFFDYSSLPELKSFTARDGTRLAYRHYPAYSEKVVILLHGAGWHSRYFLPLRL
jgi:non-heme chloroperoxidase